LVGGEHRRLATFDHMLRAAVGMGRIGGEHAAGDQPVEQHANGGQMLFCGRFLEAALHRLDVCGDVQRLDVSELTDLMTLAPGEEPAHRMKVSGSGVLVANGGGKKLQEATRRLVAGGGDDRWHGDRARDPHRLVDRDDGQLPA
jgi:hypothetical protein